MQWEPEYYNVLQMYLKNELKTLREENDIK
jgi:hypothetical protein